MSPLQGSPRASSPERRLFISGAALALGAVVVLGWQTGLRGALHAVLIFSGAVALLPFILVSSAVLALGAASVVAALVAPEAELLTAGAVDGMSTGGSKLTRAYYGLLWRLRRHALAWGIGAGLALGTVSLLVALWVFVVPREAETLGILLRAQAQIDAEHRATRRYPAAAPDGYLRAALPPGQRADEASEPPLRDAFGHPILYRRDGSWLTASYMLASLGFDGQQSSDDICVTGRTHVSILMDRLGDPLQWLDALRKGSVSFSEQVEALNGTRCSRLAEARGAIEDVVKQGAESRAMVEPF